MAGGPAPSSQQGGSGIFGGAAGAPPTDTTRGLPMVGGLGMGGGLGAATPSGVQQMMTQDTPTSMPVAVPQQPSTVGIGLPPEMMRQAMQQPMRAPIQQRIPMQQPMMQQQPMFRQPMMVPQYGGLQSLFNAMMMQQRMQPMRMPTYQSPALSFRPNMQQVQQNLSRVKPSVYQSDLDSARSRIAELEAQLRPAGGDSGSGGA